MNPSTLPIQNEFQSCLDCCPPMQTLRGGLSPLREGMSKTDIGIHIVIIKNSESSSIVDKICPVQNHNYSRGTLTEKDSSCRQEGERNDSVLQRISRSDLDTWQPFLLRPKIMFKTIFCKAALTANPCLASRSARSGLSGEAQTFVRLMKGDSGVVLAGRLLAKAAPSFYRSTRVPKQELARTLNAISIYLAEIAEALRFGGSPVPSSALLRAKTITLIIVAREAVPEQVVREIARQLVYSTRFLMLFHDGHPSVDVASEYEAASKIFKNVSERLAS